MGRGISVCFLSAALTLAAVAESRAREVSFLTWRRFPYGVQSHSLDAADFNGDGYDDLAVLDGALVVLLLSDGRGGFSPPLLHRQGGYGAQQLVARDVNHDGHADVAVVYQDGDLWAFFGDARGGLDEGRRFPTGGSPTSLTAADFDGDGDVDVAIADAGGSITGRVRVLLNDGNANFTAVGMAVPAGRDPNHITSGDFDGDGLADVAVTNGFERTATILFGDGKGGFVDPVSVITTPSPTSPAPSALAAGDLNGDGRDDLLVGNGLFALPEPPDHAGAVQRNDDVSFGNGALFLGSATRTFSPPRFLPIDVMPTGLQIVDANSDGRPDIAAGGGIGILTLLAQPDGTFARRGTVGGLAALALTSGHFNDDAALDFALSGEFTRADVFFGLGGGRLPASFFLQTEPESTFGAPYPQPSEVVAADVNSDGLLDLVTATGADGTLVSFLGLGDGDFAPPLASPASGAPYWLAAADFTGDGKVEIMVRNDVNGRGTLQLFAGDGCGRFVNPRLIAGEKDFAQIVVADFDQDGKPDMAAVRLGGVDVFLNRGAGNFRRGPSLSTRWTRRVVAADINHDGAVDLLVVNRSDVSVFLNRGAGLFADRIDSPSGTNAGGIVGAGLADFNADGFPDLAISQTIGVGGHTKAFGPFWLRGDGTGRFLDPVHLTPEYLGGDIQGAFGGVVTARDINGDGNPDIALDATDSLTVFRGDGHGGFASASPFFPLPEAGYPLTLADLNGDGLPDVMAASLTGDMQGNFMIKVTLLFNDSPPDRLVLGDANCDERVGEKDLVVLARRLFSELHFPACRGADANEDTAITAADLTATVVATTTPTAVSAAPRLARAQTVRRVLRHSAERSMPPVPLRGPGGRGTKN